MPLHQPGFRGGRGLARALRPTWTDLPLVAPLKQHDMVLNVPSPIFKKASMSSLYMGFVRATANFVSSVALYSTSMDWTYVFCTLLSTANSVSNAESRHGRFRRLSLRACLQRSMTPALFPNGQE